MENKEKEVCSCPWDEQRIRQGYCQNCEKPHWSYAKYELGWNVAARV